MATYEIPDEPKTDTLWTVDQETGEPIEWFRQSEGWSQVRGGPWHSWTDLVVHGPVFDEHPVWGSVPPTPWITNQWGDIIDAKGMNVEPSDHAALIIKSVNAYAAQFRH